MPPSSAPTRVAIDVSGLRQTSRSVDGLSRRVRMWAFVALLGLLVAGVWTNHAVNESVDDILADDLTRVLNADIEALKLWGRLQKAEVKAWAELPRVRDRVVALTQLSRDAREPRAALLAATDRLAFTQLLKPQMSELDISGFFAIDRSGLVLGAQDERFVGLRLSASGMALLDRVYVSGVELLRPFRPQVLVDADVANIPIMLAAATVSDNAGEVVGLLGFILDARRNMVNVLSVARTGESGQTYAFDDRGVLLSSSPFEKQLADIGLIEAGTSSILRVEVRDPGGDLTRGFETDVPPAARPMTRMAAEALAGRDGIDLHGYRDFRGVRVIGAWRWLDEFDIGLATEIEQSKALRDLRPLRIAFWSMWGLLTVAAAAILLNSFAIGKLRRRITTIERLGQYTLVEKIGEGGMGAVYEARHAMLRRPTAIKILRPEQGNDETIARFEREVQLTSQLGNPHTVEIYDFGRTPEGLFYYVMEYLPGLTLADLIARHGALPPARTIYLLRQVCESLEEAHAQGLVHRDIKPLNIIVSALGGQADVVKVLDFGLVKDVVNPEPLELTMPEVLSGTPLYVAPERLRDPQRNDARTDIYSLGAVAFNLLTARDVFSGASAMELCHQVLQTPPPRPSEHSTESIPAALDQVVLDCLAKDPDDRPQSVGHIIEILDGITAAGSWGQVQARAWWSEHAAGQKGAAQS